MAVGTFATPFTHATPFGQWGASPHGYQGYQGVAINPYALQQYTQSQPLMGAPLSSAIAGPAPGAQSPYQVLPLLQIVPQQLQHLQQLVSLQLQELQQLQQIVQLLPAQLQQLQQLVQYVPQQLQQLQQASSYQSPFTQGAGFGSNPTASPWGLGPQAFGGQQSHVM